MLQSKSGSKDRKTQKIQGWILNALGTTSKVTNTLLELENSKNLNTATIVKNISTMSHGCTD